jgi:hypothetical protein
MKRWTPKLAVARSRRNLAGAADRLRAVSIEWADVDGFIEQRAEELIRELEAFADEIRDSVNERLEAGEHIGL